MQSKLAMLQPKFKKALNYAQEQVKSFIDDQPDYFPMYTDGGIWVHTGEAWTNWCEGFLGGIMWIIYVHTGDSLWREKAEHYSRLIEDRKTDRTIHDLGFLFWPTWKRWYDLTRDESIKDVVITAGKTMGLRFMEKGGYLRSFIAPESLFIDIMMNVGIVFYAAQQTGDKELLKKAHKHCKTTRKYLVRGDGSTAHEGIFDLDTGEFLRQTTHQGWRGDSTWARGLAWSLYGFSTVYEMTGDFRYLRTARLCADYYLEKTPFEENSPGGPGIPPNDFDDPSRPVLYESSAASIASSGLLTLGGIVQDPIQSRHYIEAALTILNTLTEPAYLANETPGWQGIIKHGIYHHPKGIGVDESVMWGDYFFLEAVSKALSLDEKIYV